MLDSVVIEVTVGLALVFLVLATMASALTEVVAKATQLRARTLWKSLAGLLGAPDEADGRAGDGDAGAAAPAGNAEGVDLGALGLTAGLRMVTLRDDPRPTAGAPASDTSSLLDDLVATPSIRAFDPAANLAKPTRVDSIPPKVFGAALLELAELKGEAGSVEDRVAALVERYSGTPMMSSLGTAAVGVGDDVDRFIDRVGGWFDAQMTRLTAIYRRFAQWILFAVGLLLAMVLNADAIEMGVALKENAQTRTAVALLADDIAADGVTANCPVPETVERPRPAVRQPCGGGAGRAAHPHPGQLVGPTMDRQLDRGRRRRCSGSHRRTAGDGGGPGDGRAILVRPHAPADREAAGVALSVWRRVLVDDGCPVH